MPPLQAKKAADAAAKPAAPKKAALLDDSAEELDPTLYFENRVKFVEGRKAKGVNPYPHKWPVTSSIPEYVAKFKDLEAGAQLKDVTVSLAGAGCRARARARACECVCVPAW
jgi:lysyl-tRNA synthetase class 2